MRQATGSTGAAAAIGRRRWLTTLVAVAALVASLLTVTAGTDAALADEHDCAWSDSSLAPDERARLLLDASTLEQKMRWLDEQAAIQPQRTEFPDGVVYPAQVDCVPTWAFVNGPHGVSADPVVTTAFPVPIAEAATWDPAISHAKGAIMAQESWRAGRQVLLGPGVASGRTPLSGRTAEYYGEDPVLSGVLAGQNILGIEEGAPDYPVLANLKHYVANEQELDREESSSNIDERTRREIYDLPFEIALREGDPGSVMCSFNQVNSVWACENPIMRDVLKEEIGWGGFVMSDFGSVHSTAPSLNAGLDMELNRPIFYAPAPLHEALEAGDITEDQIDAAAFRVLRAFFEVGLFDRPAPVDDPAADVRTPESLALAQRMAEEGSVLLANDGVLPLVDSPSTTVAVIGQTATDPEGEDDDLSAVNACTARFELDLGFFQISRPSVGCPDPVSPLEGIEARASGDVLFADGSDIAEAAAVAAEADVAVVLGYYPMGEFQDIEDLSLDNDGDELIAAVAAAAPQTVVLLQTGSAVEMPWLDDVDAVMQTWYPGREMGTAIARLLYGDVNPSGKLPMTFPVSVDDTPTGGLDTRVERYPGVVGEDGIRQVEYSEGLQVGYRWYEAQGIEPLFAFGHGLSYTTFEYSQVNVTPRVTDGTKDVRVRFRVTNTGDVTGEEVAQVYVELPDEAGEPFKRLVGWEKLELAPGEHRNVQVTLSADDLRNRHLLEYWDEDTEAWTTPSGTFTFHVGGSSRDLPLSQAVQVR